ncbi:MAG: 50S ribosomal protein L18 [Myxococcales bacterium]|nr:50S ribosomal protein L18 [Myxococcales bacterium]
MRHKYHDERLRRREARRARVRRRISRSTRTRLTVFRSSKHIYAQLVDAETGRTIGAVSSRSEKVAGGLSSTGNIEAARRVGEAVAELAREKQIERVVFDRNGFLFHGRVKALAEAAREAGLRF